MLGWADPFPSGSWDKAIEPPPDGQPLGEIRPLFPRQESPESTSVPAPPTANASPAPPLEIRAARVVEAAPHPSADRLYILKLDLGSATTRTVVAGMRSHFKAEELVGKRVALLANLAPRTIRGFVSEGMVLAAESGSTLALVTPEESVDLGATIEGVPNPPPVVQIEALHGAPLVVGTVSHSDGSGATELDLGETRSRVSQTLAPGTQVVVRKFPDGSIEIPQFSRGRILSPSSAMPAGTKVR
jgi:methionine--tRNA ligase beta chain